MHFFFLLFSPLNVKFFFFSSRRRHTISKRDWSSDVCSSDLTGLDEKGQPRNVKGVAANAQTKRLYVTTTHTLTCLDLVTEKILWEKAYEGGCDRLALAPDG